MKGRAHCQLQESQTHGVDLLGEQWCLWYLRAQALGANMREAFWGLCCLGVVWTPRAGAGL